MISTISVQSNFFNHSPGRQGALEAKYPNAVKSKLLPLCRTRWAERLNALEVTIYLIEAVVETLTDMTLNRRWNRDTVAQASALLKSIDFVPINLRITQRVLEFTSSITSGLPK